VPVQAKFRRILSAHPVLCFAVVSAFWILLLYHRALTAPFAYDDLTIVQKNPALRSWSGTLRYFAVSASFSADFLGVSGSYYRPLTWLSFALDRRLWGLEAAGFHFTNLALTWLNAILAFVLLKRLGVSLALAMLAPLVWLGLPVNSEAVIWISARCYSLSVFFLLTTLLLARSYLIKNRLSVAIAYFCASLASLLSHETGLLIVPLTVLLAFAQNKLASVSRRLLHLLLAGFGADAIYFLLKHLASRGLPSSFSLSLYSAATEFFQYLAWMLLPLGMSIERSTDTPPNTLTSSAVIAWIAFGALCGGLIVVQKKFPELAGGWCWMTLALLPFCLIALYQGMGERYTYLASLGLAFAVVGTILRSKKRARSAAGLVAVAWVLWGAWCLEARAADWSNEAQLYRSSLETTPRSWVLLLNLGNAYLQNAQYDAAKEAYQRALTVNPKAVKAAINLAASLQMLGDLAGAEKEYQYALSLAPSQGDIYTNLGSVVFGEGKTAYAEQLLKRAVSLNAYDATAYFDLAVLYQRSGRYPQAAEMFEKTLALNPEYPDARRGLDQARAKMQQSLK
jgi:protein O-mannosyl-transferase